MSGVGRAFVAGAISVWTALLITASYVSSIRDPGGLEGLAFLPLLLLLATAAAALTVVDVATFAALLWGSVVAGAITALAWSRVRDPELVAYFVAAPTVFGALIGAGIRAMFTRVKRSWETFRDEAHSAQR